MNTCFVIMQIGNPELDEVYYKTIKSAIESCGLEAKRIDEDKKGDLITPNILNNIEESQIIIGDITNERQNCYFEIGYAMGLGKKTNLILTVQEDYKIHFDLMNFPLVRWNKDNLCEKLIKEIKARQSELNKTIRISSNPWDENWIASNREKAMLGLRATGQSGFMEIRFALDHPKININQKSLKEAANVSIINYWGHPIGDSISENPQSTVDGIIANLTKENTLYEYLTIRTNGDFYLLQSFFEDSQEPNKLLSDISIERVTKTLYYCTRLYKNLGVDSETYVNISILHDGLRNRVLDARTQNKFAQGTCNVEEPHEKTLHKTFTELESNILFYVKEITSSLFMLFDFATVPDENYENIVTKFLSIQIT
ncbi:MAG: hypothetical protein HQK91_07865 [Nitrospirae bacterium]|nr:hypothetical protein [Nitrospirota bacterium]